jgi:DegV family protein with EDD domain
MFMKIRIVADSSADLRTAEDKSIVSVPLKIMTDEKEYIDNEELDIKAMTEDLASYKGKSGSACPGVGDWIDAFGDADWVFAITITSNLSGSYNSARVAKETYEGDYPERRVYVIDSLSTGPEMQIIVEKLQELIQDGKNFDEICSSIQAYQKRTFLLFCLKSLTNLANNGRVSPAVAKIAGILGIHVIGRASEEGTLEQKDKVRGERKAIPSILSNMKKMGYKGGKVIIDHCFNENAAKQLKELIRMEFKHADIRIGTTKGLCSFYAEQGGLLIGFES